ncbi:MAG TPA: mannose-1-phosphate guanylyltransferase/mannose-6-phosphate isomerase [Bacteriovoracaceae bacterium]|nr:mannose-1-phosphate guanylyltransferase/mannose-6-phosphate isomerase [Bacteriovoracaceae bacterium]
MKVIILCGGSGTRLWPISRTLYPKQFVKLFGKESLFQKTLSRNTSLASSFSVVINQEQYFMGLDQMAELKIIDNPQFILEPIGRNTAPAIAIAAMASKPDEVLLIVPSDHLIEKQDAYEAAVKQAMELAGNGQLVTFGIKPDYAETGYGYIEADGHAVKSFKEKPTNEKAREYVAAGNYYWNSGMFCFKASVYLEELKKHAPDIYEQCLKTFKSAKVDSVIRLVEEDMKAVRSESIDYAVMERSDKVKVIPSDIGWSDLGSFDALYGALPKDAFGNTLAENVINLGSKNNLIISNKRLVSTIDVEDLIIVDTQDAVVIAKKGSTQKVKELVAEVTKRNPEMAKVHMTAHRPWGNYTILEENEGYKVKQITVLPGAKLSLQYHHHRSEHWIVVKGIATVTVNDKTFDLKQNESTYIPKEATHRLFNQTKDDLVLIEAQVGSYLGEDDIVRLQDDYKRK